MDTSNMLRIVAPTQTSNILKMEGPSADQPRARTFNMTMKDEGDDSDVVAGTLSVYYETDTHESV